MTQASVKPELLPCPNPWCASHRCDDAELRDAHRPIVEPSRASFEFRASCPVCPISGPWGDTEAEAIVAWNTRSTCNAYPELIGALGEAREVVDAAVELAAGMRGRVANADRSHANLKGLLAKIDALLARRQS